MIEGSPAAISRREAIKKSLGTLALAVALTAADVATGDAQQQKMAQKLVQYQQTPKSGQKCSLCLHFVPPDGCKVVDGKINPEGWCALFAPKPKSK